MWLLQVTLVHLYQAGMFADLDQIHGTPRATQPGLVPEPPVALHARPGAKVSIAEAPLREEVQNKLQRLPPALFNKCQQVHSQSAQLLPQLVMFIDICSFAQLIPSCNCPGNSADVHRHSTAGRLCWVLCNWPFHQVLHVRMGGLLRTSADIYKDSTAGRLLMAPPDRASIIVFMQLCLLTSMCTSADIYRDSLAGRL